jgi:hypothetical protein
MSVMPASAIDRPITRPSELELPPEARLVLANLTPFGRQHFIDEIFLAMEEAKRRDDWRPVQRVVRAWYRTLILRSDPKYAANLRSGGAPDRGEARTMEQIRSEFTPARADP